MAFEMRVKHLPRPSLALVFHPASDREYRHFENASDVPFEASSSGFSRVNAWWLAEAALLSYWDNAEARAIFGDRAALDSEPFQNKGTQGYVAWNHALAIVTLRGTEPDSILDIATDARIAMSPWDVPSESVHMGFRDALNDAWDQVIRVLSRLGTRPVWFTGHSLGAALATLAGDRFVRQAKAHGLGPLGGIYTFGSPLVGNRHFVDGFNQRCGDHSFRFVNDRDSVTRLPPRLAGYRHVNNERFVGAHDPNVWLDEPLIDHTPRRYAVLIWNALVDALQDVRP
jgi:triacylglycerol lipase